MGKWLSIEDLNLIFGSEQAWHEERTRILNAYLDGDNVSNRKKLKSPNDGVTPLGENTIKKLYDIRGTFAGRYNGYICNTCDKGYLTLDVDYGTTPAVTPCFATEGCTGEATSLGYPKGEPPLEFGEPVIHWYKPTEEELDTLSSEMLAHIVRGGLLRKASKDAPDWVKAIA